MLRRSTKTSLILYLAFWAVYLPVVLIIWRSSNSSLLSFTIALLIGLGFVLTGIAFKEKYLDSGRLRLRRYRRTYLSLDDFEDDDSEEEFEEVTDTEEYIGFRNLFSNNHSGGGVE